MRNRLEAVKTELTFSQIAAGLFEGWTRLEGTKPTLETLAVFLAQSALETAHWKKSYCFNLGNAKASDSWPGDYCFYFADEIVLPPQAAKAVSLRAPRTDGTPGPNVETHPWNSGKVRVTVWPDHPWCRFRAFVDLASGVDDYLGLLKRRYAPAWNAAAQGDVEGYIRLLREGGYFTGDLAPYLDTCRKLFVKFSKQLLAEHALFPAPEAPGSAPAPAAPQAPPASGVRPLLTPGSTGSFVAELQGILVRAGYAGVAVTGTFDEATRSAVLVFQSQHQDSEGRALGQDGKVGKNTWWALLKVAG